MEAFSLDYLTDTDFEQFCYDMLIELGFVNLNWRKGTGFASSPSDQGRDIECQLLQTGVDRRQYFETWFVECKHYKQGVPPDKIQGALSWAASERPDKLLIIASNFLSNPTKENLKIYQRNNAPTFKIQYWERSDIERLVAGRSVLLRKYKLSDDFPFLSLLHPAHIAYLHSVPLNTLEYLFKCLDRLEPQKRDHFIGWVSEPIIQPRYRQPVTGDEPMASLRIDEVSYEVFKKKCYEIVHTGIIDQMILTYFIVSFALQSYFTVSDTTAIDKPIASMKGFINFLEQQMEEKPEERERLTKGIESTHEMIKSTPDRIRKNYEEYTYFCEHVISELLAEKYLGKNSDANN